ncbi:hypothetical protein [Nocardiopsis valliformis]|nr:hypothetical protein [Nocardiopsis valliformis]
MVAPDLPGSGATPRSTVPLDLDSVAWLAGFIPEGTPNRWTW